MKWYNEDKTKCVNLDSVDCWEYKCKDKFLWAGVKGRVIYFYDDEAYQLYKMLISEREVI